MTEQLPLEITVPSAAENDGILRGATLSACQRYRYELTRRWDYNGPVLDWVMLNPSTADALVDDPTIRRCMSFARSWGYAGIRVTNLFAYRATDPDELGRVNDPFGPDNSTYLQQARGPITICAWGSHKFVGHLHQNADVFQREDTAFMCLGYNKDGSPKHPLYVPANRGVSPWPKPDPRERHY